MASPFSFFSKHPSQLGVDIGTAALKVVELEKGKQLPKLNKYAILETQAHLLRPGGAIQSSSVKLSQNQLVELLNLAKQKGKFKAKSAVASVPEYVAFTAIVDLPEMGSKELEQAISFQAHQYIPVPLNEVNLQWLKVGEYKNSQGFTQQQIMLIAVPLSYIKQCQGAFSTAGLSLASLEVEQLALVRGAVGADQTPTLVVDLGARSMNIIVAEHGQLTFAVQADHGGATITTSLAQSLGINPMRAEALKRERGFVDAGPAREVITISLTALETIVGEIKKALYTYETRFQRKAPIERVVLTGGTANLRGIEQQLARLLALPTARAASLYRLEYASELEPLTPELGPILSLATGLALPAVS